MDEKDLEKASQDAEIVKEDTPPQPQEQQFDQLAPFLTILNFLNRPRRYLSAAPTFVPKTLVDQLQFVDDGVNKWLYVYVNKTWVGIKSGVSGGAGGSNTEVQFNDGGALGGDPGLVYNKTTNTLSTDILTLLTALAVAYGGTGASTAAGARANLGAQAQDNDLDALAAIASNGILARTGAGTAAARTITAGTGITVTNGDGVSGNPTIALTSPATGFSSKVRVYLGSDQTITGGSGYTRINFDTENFDGDSEYDNLTNYRFTAGSTGYYLVTVHLALNVTTMPQASNSNFYIHKNGSAINQIHYFTTHYETSIIVGPQARCTDIVNLSAGDYIDIRAIINSGSDQKILANSYLAIHRLS